MNLTKEERPYSQKELEHIRTRMYRSLHIGKILASHKKCNHFYYTKEGGRKEKDITESGNHDSGNCSVCWKINKLPQNLRESARQLVEKYKLQFHWDYKDLTYDYVMTESQFYKLLYRDFN